MRQTFGGLSRTIAGMVLIGLGLFILSGEVADAAARLSGFTGVNADPTQTFGEPAVVGLTASRVVLCCLFDRAGFARSLGQILISFWPLCLLTAGAILTVSDAQTNAKSIRNKIWDLSS